MNVLAVIIMVGIFLKIGQHQWERYQRAVDTQNATLDGFRLWRYQMRALVRQQPRVNVRRGAARRSRSGSLCCS